MDTDQKDSVLLEALMNVSNNIGIGEAQLCKAIGIQAGVDSISADSIAGKKALQLVRIHKLLLSLVGNQEEAAHWLRTRIKSLDAIPLDLITQDG